MDCKYERMAKIFKALSDPKRVKIVDLLSCGEMCGCMLLKCFEISQPTLAHDMKVLTEAGIVVSRRAGQRTLYTLNGDVMEKMNKVMKDLIRKDQEQGGCCPPVTGQGYAYP